MPFFLDDLGNHFGIIINNQVELQSKTNATWPKGWPNTVRILYSSGNPVLGLRS